MHSCHQERAGCQHLSQLRGEAEQWALRCAVARGHQKTKRPALRGSPQVAEAQAPVTAKPSFSFGTWTPRTSSACSAVPGSHLHWEQGPSLPRPPAGASALWLSVSSPVRGPMAGACVLSSGLCCRLQARSGLRGFPLGQQLLSPALRGPVTPCGHPPPLGGSLPGLAPLSGLGSLPGALPHRGLGGIGGVADVAGLRWKCPLLSPPVCHAACPRCHPLDLP